MRKQTVDIIDTIIQLLTVDFVIDTSAVLGNNFFLESRCTWWLSIKDKVTIAGNLYEIVAFDINVSITVKSLGIGGMPIANTTFNLPQPEYIHATLKMAQNQIDAINNKEELVPLVYLFEAVRDRKNTDDESMINRETELRIFFLNSANSKDWLTDDHYVNVIEPMQQMADLFIKKIKNNKRFADNLNYDCLPLINLSQEGQQESSIFDCNLSGIEIRLFADIREDLSCENQTKC